MWVICLKSKGRQGHRLHCNEVTGWELWEGNLYFLDPNRRRVTSKSLENSFFQIRDYSGHPVKGSMAVTPTSANHHKIQYRLNSILETSSRYSKPSYVTQYSQWHMEDKLFTSVINNDKHVLSHTSYLILIITLIISGLGDMNWHWRLKAMLETFLKDSYSKTNILITTIWYFVLHFLFTVLCCLSFLLCCCVLTADFTH